MHYFITTEQDCFPAFSFIEMYLRPPSASEEARINDWIKVRQSGIRYYLSLGDQRIVDKNFIIRPKAEFEVKFQHCSSRN